MRVYVGVAVISLIGAGSAFASYLVKSDAKVFLAAQDEALPPEIEPGSSHLYVYFDGAIAEELFNSIPGVPVEKECTGASAKEKGGLRCEKIGDQEFQCALVVNLESQRMESLPC